MRLHDTITRLRAGSSQDDEYGNPGGGWSAPISVEYPAEVQPLSSDESVVDQQRTDTRWRLWLYPDADLVATDRIEWDGQVYEIEGDVERWKQRGRLHHLRAILTKVTQGAV